MNLAAELSEKSKATRQEQLATLYARCTSEACEAAGRGETAASVVVSPLLEHAITDTLASLRKDGFDVRASYGGSTRIYIDWSEG